MHRPILTCAFLALVPAAVCAAQQTGSSDPYQGQSNPPADDAIVTSQPEQPKPPAAKRATTPAPAPAETPKPTSVDPAANFPSTESQAGSDGAFAQGTTDARDAVQPRLSKRDYANDPDGDIVHPNPLPPGVLEVGTTIRVRLLTRLSSTQSEHGDQFRSQVASDVLQEDKVLIPAGSEIDGHVSEVSTGHVGTRGSVRLSPDTVILPDGKRYRLEALVSGTPGSNTRVRGEGNIEAGSRKRKDEIEYGAAVGAGAIAGVAMGGPVGALTGGLIGAGAVTVHLLSNHPQAHLEPGSVLLLTLNERLNLNQAGGTTTADSRSSTTDRE